jgi:hypothetical protein
MMFMLFLVFRVDQDIIKVHDADWINKVSKGFMNIGLKGR